MLQLNLKPMLAMRGITNPLNFLVKAGFSYKTANNVTSIKVSQLEKLCKALYCTPNDLMDWEAEGEADEAGHPLQELNKEKINDDLYKAIQKMPLSKLKELNNALQSDKNNE